MNIVVIGLGSMGRRRVRLIQEMYPEFVIVGVDGREDRRDEANSTLGICCYPSVSNIEGAIDCAFICTSPLSHAPITTECLRNGWHVFTELNLVQDHYDENMELAKERGCTLFLSSTFLYREETRYIASKVMSDRKWNYIYHIGQYLPDWHPWESYNDFFVGDRRTNGCREILAIELPWLIRAFGEVVSMQPVYDRMTALDIKFDDNYMVLINHENGNKGALVVDVVSPVAVRRLEAYSENEYIAWNGTPDSICEFDAQTRKLEAVTLRELTERVGGYSAFIVENAYKNEIREFFNVVLGRKKQSYDFEQDGRILSLIDSLGA